MAKKELTPAEEIAAIQKKLGHNAIDLPVRHWLDTGSKLLNSVLGSPTRGLAYGKMIELRGWESSGKTLLMLKLAAMCQEDGASVGWMDLENSLDEKWAGAQGLDISKLYLFKPRILQIGKKKDNVRLQFAEELFEEAELWMAGQAAKGRKIFFGCDSITGILTAEEAEAGLTDQNRRTKVSRASFLSQLLCRWCALMMNYNTMTVFINQLRMAPGVAFGNPERTTGGNALRYYCSIQANLRRVKGGRIKQSGRVIGLRGILKNIKNKTGEGSLEGFETGFKAYFLDNKWKCIPSDKLKKEAGGDGE